MSKFKSFIKKNGKKIVIGVGLIALAGVGGYFGYKYVDLNNKYIKVSGELDVNTIKTDILYEAASEGLFEQAIATTIRKLDYRRDRIKALEEHLKWSNDHKECIQLDLFRKENSILENRLVLFEKAQEAYEIKDA